MRTLFFTTRQRSQTGNQRKHITKEVVMVTNFCTTHNDQGRIRYAVLVRVNRNKDEVVFELGIFQIFLHQTTEIQYLLGASITANTTAQCTVDRTHRMSYFRLRSEEHTSELQSRFDLVCRL